MMDSVLNENKFFTQKSNSFTENDQDSKGK